LEEIFYKFDLKTPSIKLNKQDLKGWIKDLKLDIKVLNLDMNKPELKG
jgi:hypothetical protein